MRKKSLEKKEKDKSPSQGGGVGNAEKRPEGELRSEDEIRKALKEVEGFYHSYGHRHCSDYMSNTAKEVLEWILKERDLFEYGHGKVGGRYE